MHFSQDLSNICDIFVIHDRYNLATLHVPKVHFPSQFIHKILYYKVCHYVIHTMKRFIVAIDMFAVTYTGTGSLPFQYLCYKFLHLSCTIHQHDGYTKADTGTFPSVISLPWFPPSIYPLQVLCLQTTSYF